MTRANKKRNYVTLALGLLTMSGEGHTASFSGHASVRIFDTIEFAEQKIVDFGALTRGDGTCSMGPTGVLEASGGSTCAGEGQIGEILISGTDGQTVSVSVEAGDSAPGVSFAPQLHSESAAVLVGGQTTAKVGGLLSLSGATAGSYSLTYIIVVNYN